MIEKDSWAYLQGKHHFSLKTPLKPKEVKSVLQSVAGSISQPIGDDLQSTMTRYFGSIYEEQFQLKKTVVQHNRHTITIEGTYKEKESGTDIEILISKKMMKMELVTFLIFLVFGLFSLFTNYDNNLIVDLLIVFGVPILWFFTVDKVWQQAKTEMKFILKLLDEAEATLLNTGKQLFDEQE